MKLKRISALVIAALMCAFILPVNAFAAKKGITLSKTSASMTVGDTLTLKRTVTGFKKCTVQWSSSDKTVASVSKGVVTAKKQGTAVITAKIKDTSYKASCKITVNKKSSGSGTKKTVYKNAEELLSKITIGWNLGNTMDSVNCNWLTNKTDYETGWGNVKTTKAMIDEVKKAGFNTLRLPVSWGDHMDANGKIDKEWLDRVQEIVDYAYDNKMYVILNTHHENGWIKLDEANEKEVTKKFKYLWKQIADRFKDYDEKLLFEGLNEPRTEGSAKEWTGGTSAEYKVLNRLHKAFVNAVREGEGYNKTRFLIVTPYAASSAYSAMAGLEIPDDDRIIVSVHAYLPYNVALNRGSADKALTDSYKREIDSVFSNIDKVFLSKGIPVIMDEFGTINKSNTKERIEIAKYYLSVSESSGVPCCWWDNGSDCGPEQGEGFGLLNRKKTEWFFPEIVKALTSSVK